MKRNEPKKQHYLPEFLQRGFAHEDGRLWLYDRHLQRFRKVHPRHLCCENDLYTFDPQGEADRSIEQQWLSRLDGDGAAAIRRFERNVELDQEWRESFAIFVAQQITRTPAFRDMTTQNFKLMGQEYLRIGFSDVERAGQMLENYRAQTGDTSSPEVTAESLVAAVRGGNLQVTVGGAPFLRHMLLQVQFLAKWIERFEWEVVLAPQKSGFIICDYPFVVVPSRERPDAVGLAFPGTVKLLPLSRGLCMRMGEAGYGLSYRRGSNEEVRILNQNIAVNSERFVMCANRRQLEHVLARSGTAAPDPAARMAVDLVQQDPDNGLVRFSFWPHRRFFYGSR